MSDKAVEINGRWYVPLEEHTRITDLLYEENMRLRNPWAASNVEFMDRYHEERGPRPSMPEPVRSRRSRVP